MTSDVNVLVEKQGQIIGKGKRDYYLFSYQMIGQRVYINFLENLGSRPSSELVVFEGLTRDWHTHIAVQDIIRDLFNSRKPNDVFEFGKYKGYKFDEIIDLDYWCWLANKQLWELEELHIRNAESIKDIATYRAEKLGAVKLANIWLNPEGQVYRDTIAFELELESGMFSYVAATNDGRAHKGIWNIYINNERCVNYSTYYGVVSGIRREDGTTKKIKDYIINTDNYYVDDDKYEVRVDDFVIAGKNF